MIEALLWKLFIAYGITPDSLIDIMVTVAVVVFYLLLFGCVAFEARYRPEAWHEQKKRMLSLLEKMLDMMFESWNWLMKKILPPSLGQTGLILRTLLETLLLIVLWPAIVELLLIRWMVRRIIRRLRRQ